MITARSAGLVGCRSCGLVAPADQLTCARCGAPLQSRDDTSLQRVWAWWTVGLLAYIPANIYPMLLTTQVFRTKESTILEGVLDLMQHGDHLVAIIIFLASVFIPVAKFVTIAFLAATLARPHRRETHQLLRLYDIVEFIGRWSMIDVFVVAILSTLVQFGSLASINPGFAAVSFALSVIFTMLAAQSFDSRMIWDQLQDGPAR